MKWSYFLTPLHVSLAKLFLATKPDLNIFFKNENIEIFVKMTLTLVQGQGEEIGHNMLHIIY